MKSPRTPALSLLLLLLLAASIVSPLHGYASGPNPREVPAPPSESAGEADRFGGRQLQQPPKVEPQLLRRLLDGDPGAQHRVVVDMVQQADLTTFPTALSREQRGAWVVSALQQTARKAQAPLLAFLSQRQSVQRVQSFWVFNGLAVTATADTILEIAARPEIRFIREDRWLPWLNPPSVAETPDPVGDGAIQWNIAQVRADLAWSILNLNGSGVTVGIMDTGVDWQHPSLLAQYRGYRPGGLAVHEGNWICTTDQELFYPVDGHGHGTHVAGTAIGGLDSSGQAIGVAPGANWIAAKTFSNTGYAYDSWLHAAFEWFLAPAGDPALAPDVINGSWSSDFSQDDTFQPDLQAVRAAGIVPVFAAGNNGPDSGSVGSPGSYPETIAIGATDDLDHVASFSGRGPSPWGEIKPEVSAPGTQIRSSLPGGTFGLLNGTSMASPHVAGVAALLLQADPNLGVDQVEAIMISTALPLGTQIPNNDTGWGRIDAYRAAAVASQAGTIVGEVLRQSDLQPLPYSLVMAYDHEGELQGQVTTDGVGRYTLALPEGIYNLVAGAFGYSAGSARGVSVNADQTVIVDFQLPIAPAGVLWGQITDAETGGPVSVQVSVEGTPALTVSEPQTGQYSLALPAGSYTVTVAQNGYRRSTAENVAIVVDEATRLDFSLAPAPTLLLVDSGRWYYGSKASFFESALDDGSYVYDLWEIRNLETDIPQETDLAPFDITIWSSPVDSPGLIGAGDVITAYLKSGGNLFLTGQDVGYWDDGLNGWIWHDYYKELLKAEALADDAGREDVVGSPEEILDGLTLPMNGSDSARNQVLPDLIDVIEPLDASLIGVYEDVGGAALRVSGCQSYNAVYLAAGLEGLGDRESRAEVMDRALTWLDTPHPGIAVRVTPLRQETVWLEGSHITYTVELQNRGVAVDQFDLELTASAWPVSIWDVGFTQEVTQSMSLGICQTQTLAVQVTVPPDTGWDVTDVVTLTARSQADPSVTAQAVFSTKTPAPILLVDDHRWYDTASRYRNALETRQLPYDQWRIEQKPAPDLSTPSLERLEHYPVVIWFTAYDWYRTLTQDEEATLSAYLDGGGRLLLTSQDYLFTSGFTGFARDCLGVFDYTESLSVTQTLGAVGHPVGRGLGAIELTYPFRNFSDALRASPRAGIAFWGQHGQPVALTMAHRPWKTAFYAFALEAFSPDDLTAVLGNAVDWLSPLGDSALDVSPPVASPGSELACTLSIRNTGPRPLSQATLMNPVPPHTSLVQGSLEGPATYDPTTRNISWTGALATGQAITVTYQLQTDRPLADGTVIENVAYLSDETGLSLDRVAVSRIDSPYLGGSVKVVSAGISPPGHVLTYTLYLQNDGLQPAEARLTDPVPVNSNHLPGSGWASSGLLTSTEQLLAWSGTIGVGEAVTITFPIAIEPAIQGFYVHNRASLTDEWGEVIPLETYTLVGARIFLPLLLRGF